MRVQVSAAGSYGWVGDGAYRYDPVQRDGREWPAMPARWAKIADAAVGKHPWDSAILNWYDADASLGWHQDLAERDHTLPIVTISLGDCQLESGAITVLEGNTRLAYHTIERIIPAPLLSPLGATRGRISITLRVAR